MGKDATLRAVRVKRITLSEAASLASATPSYQPPRLPPSAVLRPRVETLIDNALAHGAAWLCAPGGAGKTTAVAQYLRNSKRDALWIRLDSADSDPAVLLLRLRNAYQDKFGAVGIPLSYDTERHAQLTPFARYFFRTLCEGLKCPFVWIFDNAHDVDAEVIESVVAAIIEEAPEHVLLIVLSRSEPGATLARAVAHERLKLVPRAAMKFDAQEAHELLAKRTMRIDFERSEQLCRDLDGWAVGLVLASGAATTVPRFAMETTLRPLDSPTAVQYFESDVFARMSPPQQQILLRTSYLPDFTAQQARALVSVADTEAHIEAIYKTSGFVEIDANGSQQTRYRVHPVLRTFLQHSLKRSASPEDFETILRESANLLCDNHQFALAADLLETLGDQVEVANIAEKNAADWVQKGQTQTLLAFIDRVPPPLIEARPYLLGWSAAALIFVDPALAEKRASQTLAAFEARGDVSGAVFAAGLLLDLHWRGVAVRDVAAIAERAIAPAEELLDCEHEIVRVDAARTYLHATAVVARERPIAQTIIESLLRTLNENGFVNTKIGLAIQFRARLVYSAGNETLIERVETRGEQLIRQPQANTRSVLWWLQEQALARLVAQDPEGSERYALEGLALAENIDDWTHGLSIRQSYILLLARSNRGQKALPYFASHHPKFREAPTIEQAQQFAVEGAALLAVARAEQALDSYDKAIETYRRTELQIGQYALGWFGRGLALLVLSRYDDARECAKTLLDADILEGLRKRVVAFEAGIDATFALKTEANDLADRLGRLFELLRVNDRRDYFGEAPYLVAELCAAALRFGIEVPFVKSMIDFRKLEAPSSATAVWPYPIRIRAFGELSVEIVADAGERNLRKSMALLQQVLAAPVEGVAIDPLIAKLWPGEGREGAQKAFEAALHRLRKRLGNDAAIRLNERRLSVNPGVVYVDVREFETLLREAPKKTPTTIVSRAERALALYRGHFLRGEDDEAINARREELWKVLQEIATEAIEITRANQAAEAETKFQNALSDLKRIAR
jgi:LuxR family transcriptional regulator, maltose regulon positive regulatory protein